MCLNSACLFSIRRRCSQLRRFRSASCMTLQYVSLSVILGLCFMGCDSSSAKSLTSTDGGTSSSAEVLVPTDIKGSDARSGIFADSQEIFLGNRCDHACKGTFCRAGGTVLNLACGVSSSSSEMPCLGTTAGMYCTRACASDDDCKPAAISMRCLLDCPKYPQNVGQCWSSSDFEFMSTVVCPGTPASGTVDSGKKDAGVDSRNISIDALARNDSIVPEAKEPFRLDASEPDIHDASLVEAPAAEDTPPVGKQVSGTIANATWTFADSPVLLMGDLVVASLTIEPGVQVLANGPFVIEIAGRINAIGTKDNPIIFSTNSTIKKWGGIFFNVSQSSELAHIVVEKASLGGIRIVDSSPTIRNCTVRQNESKQGGGIYISGKTSAPVIKNCKIQENSATDFFEAGGGVFVMNEANPIISNTIIAKNSAIYANARGGGIYVCSGKLTLSNVTVVENGNSTFGNGSGGIAVNMGGLSDCRAASLVMTNSIAFNNKSFQISESYADVSYSNVQGSYPGTGNTAVNPLFADETYHLLDGASPCIDTGDPSSTVNDVCLPPSLGTPRNDMGAYGGPSACHW